MLEGEALKRAIRGDDLDVVSVNVIHSGLRGTAAVHCSRCGQVLTEQFDARAMVCGGCGARFDAQMVADVAASAVQSVERLARSLDGSVRPAPRWMGLDRFDELEF